jgi:hypothetical protein
MARVAQRGILLTEPADANVTRILVRLRIMKPHEEAGNLCGSISRSDLSHFAATEVSIAAPAYATL